MSASTSQLPKTVMTKKKSLKKKRKRRTKPKRRRRAKRRRMMGMRSRRLLRLDPLKSSPNSKKKMKSSLVNGRTEMKQITINRSSMSKWPRKRLCHYLRISTRKILMT